MCKWFYIFNNLHCSASAVTSVWHVHSSVVHKDALLLLPLSVAWQWEVVPSLFTVSRAFNVHDLTSYLHFNLLSFLEFPWVNQSNYVFLCKDLYWHLVVCFGGLVYHFSAIFSFFHTLFLSFCLNFFSYC